MNKLIDNSQVECYLRCPRRYFYRYGLGWKSDRTSVHLVWGEAWHRVLATWYTAAQTTFEDTRQACVSFGENYYREHFSPADDADNAPKTCAALSECFKDYVEAYAEEDKGYTTLAVEIGFKLEIGPGVWMSGRIDHIVQDNFSGDLLIRDHKSMKNEPKGKALSQWNNSGQGAVYTAAVRRKFPEHHVRQFDIDWIVPRIPTSKLKTALSRTPVYYTDAQLASRLRMVEHWINRIQSTPSPQSTADMDTQYPQNWTSCFDFFTLCSFFQQCSEASWVDPHPRIQLGPPRGMTVEHWDPLEDLKCSEVWELPLL